MTTTRPSPAQGAMRVLKDVRALGASAPLRAAYETSKRTNFHKVLFREVDPEAWTRARSWTWGRRCPPPLGLVNDAL